MNTEQLSIFVARFAEGLPRQIGKQLEDVEFIICDTPELATEEVKELVELAEGEVFEPIPADAKGVFIGEPLEREDSDGEEDDFETVALPSGLIVIVASNVKDTDEATLICLHEIGHALGLDEDGVKALGLGLSATGAPNDGPTKDSDQV